MDHKVDLLFAVRLQVRNKYGLFRVWFLVGTYEMSLLRIFHRPIKSFARESLKIYPNDRVSRVRMA